MADAILVLNAGSSSLKFSVFLNRKLPGETTFQADGSAAHSV
jgi:acetate kinase